MSTRQYIGARYVPKFYENSDNSSEWTPNTQYEPLTIVTLNGNSYTSKKTVPASVGSPALNGDYWASTGLYNAQVEAVRQLAESLATNYEHLSDNVLTCSMESVIVMGDSYMDGWNGSGYVAHSPANIILAALGKTVGVNGYKWTQGGMQFIGSGGISVIDYINAHKSEIADKNKVTKIIIGLGYNDAIQLTESNYNVFASLIGAVDTLIKSTFPNAKVYLSNNTAGYTDLTEFKKIKISEQYKNGCIQSNWAFLGDIGNTLKVGGGYPLISSDGIHPNQNGMYYLAGAMLSALRGDYNGANFSWMNTSTAKVNVFNDYLTLALTSVYISSGLVSNVSCDGFHPIYTVTYPNRICNGEFLIGTQETVCVFKVGSTFEVIPCAVKFYNNKIDICPVAISGGGYRNLTANDLNIVGVSIGVSMNQI